tara:strand:- start:1978 stop:2151 length:174 start_codon:yes stop_codon:yes gene_type:complete
MVWLSFLVEGGKKIFDKDFSKYFLLAYRNYGVSACDLLRMLSDMYDNAIKEEEVCGE